MQDVVITIVPHLQQDRVQRLASNHPALIAALLITAAAAQHPQHGALLLPLLSTALPASLDALDATPCAPTLRTLSEAAAVAAVAAVRRGGVHADAVHAAVMVQVVRPSPVRCSLLADVLTALARYAHESLVYRQPYAPEGLLSRLFSRLV